MKIKEIFKVADSAIMKKSIFILILFFTLDASAKCGADVKNKMQTIEYEKAVSSYVSVISRKIAQQLDKNSIAYKRKTTSIQIKPIVNLYDPKISSIATQKITENLLHEMFLKGFKMVDGSAKSADCELLGTYINYKRGMLINARVVNKRTREVYTSAKVFVTREELKSINKIYNKYSWFSQN